MQKNNADALRQCAKGHNKAVVKINGANEKHNRKGVRAVGCRFDQKAENSGNNNADNENPQINRQRKGNGNRNALSALEGEPKRKAMAEKNAERAKGNGVKTFNLRKKNCANY